MTLSNNAHANCFKSDLNTIGFTDIVTQQSCSCQSAPGSSICQSAAKTNEQFIV